MKMSSLFALSVLVFLFCLKIAPVTYQEKQLVCRMDELLQNISFDYDADNYAHNVSPLTNQALVFENQPYTHKKSNDKENYTEKNTLISTELNDELQRALAQDNIQDIARILLQLPYNSSLLYENQKLPVHYFVSAISADLEKKLIEQDNTIEFISNLGTGSILIYLLFGGCLLFVKNSSLKGDEHIKYMKYVHDLKYILFLVSGFMGSVFAVARVISQDNSTLFEKFHCFIREFMKRHPLAADPEFLAHIQALQTKHPASTILQELSALAR